MACERRHIEPRVYFVQFRLSLRLKSNENQTQQKVASSHFSQQEQVKKKLSLENPDDYPPLLLCATQFLQQNTVYLFLSPEQHTLLDELLLELQTLVQGPHLALHVCPLSLSQIPGGGRDRVDTHTHTHAHTQSSHYPGKKKRRPPLLWSPRWCNPIF